MPKSPQRVGLISSITNLLKVFANKPLYDPKRPQQRRRSYILSLPDSSNIQQTNGYFLVFADITQQIK